MRQFYLLRCTCLAASVVACCSFTLAQKTQPVAHVLDLTGSWRIAGANAALVRGQGLAEGAEVVSVSNQPGDSITIVQAKDFSRLQIFCDATPSDPCRVPVAIQPLSTPAAAATSEFATLAHAAFSLLMGSSPATASQYAVTMARSLPPEKLQEAVIPLSQDGPLLLPHSPGGIPVGSYTLLIAPIGSAATTKETTVLSPGGAWQAIPFTATGLFQVSVRDVQDHHIANLMLLVVKEDRAVKTKAAFDEAKDQTHRWYGPNARRDEHLFLRAFLQSECDAQ